MDIVQLLIGYQKHKHCFTIDPKIRGLGRSYDAWNTFLEFIKDDWSYVKTDRILIEVYTKNCIVWGKVMKVVNLEIDDDVTKMRVKNPVVIMGKNMISKEDSISAYLEWQEIEQYL